MTNEEIERLFAILLDISESLIDDAVPQEELLAKARWQDDGGK